MLVTCWSVKGGSGTTTVAAALAVLLARRCPAGAVLADVGGDAPSVLGLAGGDGPGLFDWWAAGDDVGSDGLRRLLLDAGGGVRVLPAGGGAPRRCGIDPPGRVAGLVEALATVGAPDAAVVIDAGPPSALADELAAAATLSLLVLRPCYLAVRLALAAVVRPSAVVLIDEPGRSLHADDVEDVLGVPVRAIIPWDKEIARAVDAGLLATRVPRPLATALRATA